MRKETLEEAAKNYAEEYKGEEQDPWFDFMEGAKWQQQRSYSEEEVLKLILTSGKLPFANDEERIEWFERNKKK